MNFKFNLKALRKEKGYTQSSLAKELKISLDTMQRYEQGVTQPQKLETLEQITKILECSYDDLLK